MTDQPSPLDDTLHALSMRRWLSFLLPSVFLVVALLMALAAGWSAEQRAYASDQRIRRDLLRNATDIAAAVPPESARALSFTADDTQLPAFEKISRLMADFNNVRPTRNIYSMRMRDQALVFGPESYAPDAPLASAPGTIYEQPPPAAKAIFSDGQPVVFGPHADEYGTFITALAPVRDPDTGLIAMVVGVEMSASEWASIRRAARRPSLLGGSLLLIVLLIGGLLLAIKYYLQPAVRGGLRHAEILFLALFGLAFSVVMGAWSLNNEAREQRMGFEWLADERVEITRQKLARMDSKLRSVQHFFEASEYVDEQEFAHFTRSLTEKSAWLSLGWIPGEGDGWAAEAQKGGDVGQVGNRGADPVVPRMMTDGGQTSYRTHYLYPAYERLELLGMDHGHYSELAAALARAARGPHYTHAALPPPDRNLEKRPLLFLYRSLTVPSTMTSDHSAQTGWVWGVLDLQTLLENAFIGLVPEQPLVDVRLHDASSIDNAFRPARFPPVLPNGNEPVPLYCKHAPFDQYRQALPAFGRVLAVTACPTDAFLAAHPIRVGYVVGGAGIIATLFLTLLVGALQRLQHDAAKHRSETKYRLLFDAMSSGFALHEMLYDEAGQPVNYRFIEVNPAFEKQTGLKSAELIGHTLYEVLPDSEPFWLARYAEVVRSGRSTHFEHFDPLLNRYFEVIAYRPAPHHFAVLVTEITPRKRIEERLARMQALQELLMQLATRFINLSTEHIDEATVTALEEVARFTRADRAYQFRYDFTEGTLTNTHEWCMEGIPPLLGKMQDLPIARYERGASYHRRGEPYYIRDVSAMDDADPAKAEFVEQDIRSLVTIPLIAGQECLGFIGFDAVRSHREWSDQEIGLLAILGKLLTNVHLRAESENERKQFEAKLQQSQKLESLGLLAGGIAHDFNNILTSVLGNADLALMDIAADSPAREPLEAIEMGARRAADLCRQMLAYAGRGSFVIETFTVNALIDEMMQLLKASISKRATLNLSLEPRLPPVKGDTAQIRQILLNLVINASEALQDKDGTITVRTGLLNCDQEYLDDVLFEEALVPGHYLLVEVADNGCGITKENLGHIFDPFYTTKFVGRGLGLSAVMGIVRAHKGALKVYSELGKGTTFKLLLPVATDAPPTAAPVIDRNPPAWHGQGTLLLVDDEFSIRKVATQMLERLGFDVITACDGVEALEQYEARRSDLKAIILDLTMPRKSGEEVLQVLRKENPSIPVIVASGYSKDELGERLAALGVSAFVQKPYTSKNLGNTLRAVMTGSAVDGEDTL